MDDKIREMVAGGMSLSQISERLKISKRTISRRLSGEDKTLDGIIKEKINTYARGHKTRKIDRTVPLDIKSAIRKIRSASFCYLTGDPINLMDKKSWSLDHKNPRSRGGTNSLVNIGVATQVANRSKQDMTVREFIEMCVRVAKHNGYVVYKK